jgi:hypothetical protein
MRRSEAPVPGPLGRYNYIETYSHERLLTLLCSNIALCSTDTPQHHNSFKFIPVCVKTARGEYCTSFDLLFCVTSINSLSKRQYGAFSLLRVAVEYLRVHLLHLSAVPGYLSSEPVLTKVSENYNYYASKL